MLHIASGTFGVCNFPLAARDLDVKWPHAVRLNIYAKILWKYS